MTLNTAEARSTLRDIEQTEARSAEFIYSRYAAPHLLLWGAVWIVGYGLGAIRPELSGVWMILGPLGGVGSMVIGMRSSRGRKGYAGVASLLAALIIFAFFFAAFAILRPSSGAQIGAFVPLVIGLFYCLGGLALRMVRLFILGAAVMALTAAGFFLLPAWFMAWMAIVGGGSLILAGLWLRSA